MITPQTWQCLTENLNGSITVAGEDAQETFLRELVDATDADWFEVITEDNYQEYREHFGESIEVGDAVYFNRGVGLAVTRVGIETWARESSDEIPERVKYELVVKACDRIMVAFGVG